MIHINLDSSRVKAYRHSARGIIGRMVLPFIVPIVYIYAMIKLRSLDLSVQITWTKEEKI